MRIHIYGLETYQGLQNVEIFICRFQFCLTSNCGQGYKVSSFDSHPAALFYRHKLPFSLSCDNLLLSGNDKLRPSPSNEILHLVRDVMPRNLADKEVGSTSEVYIEHHIWIPRKYTTLIKRRN